jgi:hypothetical protein
MVIQSFKKITGAALVVGGLSLAGSVQAAINWDGYLGSTQYGGNGSGEIFLSAFDPVGQRSVNYDLGITVQEYRTNPQAFAGTLFNDPTLLSFISATADPNQIRWNMGGISYYRNTTVSPYDYTGLGYVLTGLSGDEVVVPQGRTLVNNAISNAANFMNGVNSVAGSLSDFASNNVVLASTSQPSTLAAYHMNGQWGSSYGGTSDNGEGPLGSVMNLYYVHPTVGSSTNSSTVVTLGTWQLTSLGLQASPAPVPVPAGIWLMGSALAGLGGMLSKLRERAAAAKS